MVNYKGIADAIPASEMSAAIAAIGPDKPKILIKNSTRSTVKDVDGNDVMQPGGFSDLATVQTAFDSIKGNTVSAPRNIMQTYIGLTKDLNLQKSSAFRAAVGAGIAANDIPDFIHDALNADGIDITNPQVESTLNGFAADSGRHGFTQSLVSSVLSTATEDVPVFRNLKIGHVQMAIQMRSEGEV